MKRMLLELLASTCTLALVLANTVSAAELVKAKDGSGYYGYSDTPVLPWCGYWVHDADRPAPKRVDPGPALPMGPMPSDATILFSGKDLAQWAPNQWQITGNCVEAREGNLVSKAKFGSFQLHLEWQTPANWEGPWQNRGNNGVMLHGLYEIQIFDSYTEKIYPDGMAGAVYGQTPPLVNVCRKPGEWQVYDIVFTAPKFEGGKLTRPAKVTMFHNGVLVHLNQEVYGRTGHRILPSYKDQVSEGPVVLYGHNCPVAFRNIWIRSIDQKTPAE